ncbi:MAG: hypothetical protein RJB55_1999 [Verrucomicrobiota bacterium]
MKLSKIAAVGAVSVASSAWAGGKVPPGWMEVADNRAQFAATQGASGWTYLFDSGFGSLVHQMPYFTSGEGGVEGWATASVIGGSGSYCHISMDSSGLSAMHPNAPNDCNLTAPGLQRPILRWSGLLLGHARIALQAEWFAPTGHDARLLLSANGQVLLDRTLAETLGAPIDFAADVTDLQAVELLEDPTADGCHSDAVKFHLTILVPDCNSNLIPDSVEIANGSVYDRNHDGVPDPCQCLADVIENGVVDGADLAALLTVWGTTGGIYPRADTNADGVVDGSDLATVLGGWGACP